MLHHILLYLQCSIFFKSLFVGITRELFSNSLHICVTRCGGANICADNLLYVFGDVAEFL